VPAAVLWDFDGTIADTESVEYEAVRAVFLDHGVDLPVESWYPIVGTVQAPDWIPHLEAAVGRPLAAAPLMEARAHQKDRLIARLRPLPGVVPLLDEAAAAGVPMGVCSNSPRRWVTGHLDRLGLRDRFAVVVAVDDVTHGKPHPEPYATAAHRLGADAEASVAIEDSETGLASAAAAGLVTVAVPGPMSARHDLSAADVVLESLAGVRLADLDALIDQCRRAAPSRPPLAHS
jgi:HAD superfamily hydrolase (TIGR01509 family)